MPPISGKRVIDLEIIDMGLEGNISPLLSNLSLLTKLSLQASLHGCQSLKFLDLSVNNLSVIIPEELGWMKRLELTHLELAVNYFTGQIPVELGALSKLEILYLHLNFLERTITATLCNCTALRAISLIENRLSGEIPSEIGNKLHNLQMKNISGRIPVTLSNLSQITLLDLSVNYLEGEVPEELGKLKNLGILYLHSNHLVSNSSLNMTAQMIEEICDRIKTVQISDSIPSLSSTTEETINSEEESVSNRIRQVSPTQGPTLPILQKIICLSDKIQNLKKEHSNLSDQVKAAKDSFLGPPNILDTLQKLGNEYELLRKKYLQELSDRKRLYNEVIELKGNIRVFCRCRPLNQVEITNGSNYVVEFDSSQDNELQIISSDSSKKQFKFDHVFEPEDNQEAVFAQTKPIVASVLDGYNVCIFAYGQTGTGKTFTMEGSPENRGVNYRTLDELFRLSQERSGIMRYGLFVSMMEVYNEKIRDLLIESSNQPPKKLEIKQTAEGTQEVPGLVETRVTGTEDVWDLLKSGSRARSVGSTSANELSSRSHCLLRVTVKGENLINGQKTRSHLWMVDLAGSERVGKIDVEGERLKESQFINKSLSALGDVISALASKTGHIPYRNSKLTHMLQSSLGGDCKTLMFVQKSPSATDLGETLCSLNFARGIESGPARKQADLSELFKYKQMVEKLKHDEKETKKLRDSLQSLQLRLAARDHICRTLQEKVRELENQLGEERKTRLKQETRAFAAAASQSTIQVVEKRKIDKKPPLCPSKLRMPLRKITNSMPPPSPLQKQKTGSVFQPKRRVSIATYRSEPTSNMTTPLQTSRYKNGNVVGRQSFVRDPRKPRNSKLFSPLPEFRTASETTPSVMRTSSKFMGSPPTQAGSWKPKHPTVVALQRKSLVWSPLKLRSFQNRRPSSLLPYRPSSTNEVQ
ncbi:KINESIN-RELATED [Salix koriyanagi]|uniref:Kinesin-like protein n=1 Tax=Salix koriyanagi TaxID=2511006 RepID=A0A9Q0P7D6_9ROSI|nr:KINESIN-RELATED [Salix koriyanagi]